MKTTSALSLKRALKWTVLVASLAVPVAVRAATAALLGWNNLGMHCMDSDYSVFSILPPYNTIEAQLIVGGKLVTTGSGYSVTYEGIADPDGSINVSSIGKGNFYTYVQALYGSPAPDMGLAGWAMPGLNNTPQSMLFEANNSPAAGVSTAVNWFRAEGIPIMPFDDAGRKNEYPLMHLVARNSANAIVASSDIVLPVSDEMDCRVCHGSGASAAAMPVGGWVNDANSERDYRLNILLLHDDREQALHPVAYSAALATRGLNPSGLFANVAVNGRPIVCASCHASEALQGSGLAGIPPLTSSIHTRHAKVLDPVSHVALDNAASRAACYLCHPGSTTRCLRGAMGSAIAADGSMEMQCQSCHGNMTQVGSPNRVGWFMEPACQSCHTGTATHNNGQIRYTSVFSDAAASTVRVAVDSTFATSPNTPATGLSLYRFSQGHGGLQCSACHGSTHAEFPTAFRNDNIVSEQLQGHVGVVAECSACHATVPNTVTGGPHGLHPMGPSWVSQHHDVVQQVGVATCQVCHGTDYRGTVLSRMQASRTLDGEVLFRGATVGCYLCHNGPGGDGNPGAAPTVSNVTVSTPVDQPVSLTLPATGTGLTLRIVSQANQGSVGLIGSVATYYPGPGFVGADTFTFAAYNGSRNSGLGTVTVNVGTSGTVAPSIVTQPVSQSVSPGTTVTFTVTAAGTAPLSYQWSRNGAPIPGATSAVLTLPGVSTASAGNYTAVVSNVAGSITTLTATLSVGTVGPVAPTIASQPVSRTVAQGATATFTVVATGTAPLSYQWRRNGTSIAGATSATLTLSGVTTSSAGSYTVRVSNIAGAVVSAAATLTVTGTGTFVVTITSPLSGASFTEGANVRISAGVSPSGNIARVAFYDGTRLLGTDTTLSYSITRTFQAGTHVLQARATSTSGVTVASPTVSITIRPPQD